jgi:hypothetical protein
MSAKLGHFIGVFGPIVLAHLMLDIIHMMAKPSVNNSDADRSHMSEPTKYIVRCCELRKRRMVKTAPVNVRPRIRVNTQN